MSACYELARNSTALIDLSGEGLFRISGADAGIALNRCFSMDLEIVLPWKGVTGLFLSETADVVAIATIFKGDDEFFVFTESAMATALQQHLVTKFEGVEAEIQDLAGDFAWLCLVGPRAQSAMAQFGSEDILGLPYLSFEDNAVLGAKLFRMGFCGEYEYRILCPLDNRDAMWEKFLQKGSEFGIAVASPEIMNILMLEMRSLQKQHLPAEANPITLGLHWMVDFRKETFPGLDVVHAAKVAPASRALMVRLDQSGMAAAGDRLQIDGQDVGFCSAIQYSPTLGKDIGLAHVMPEFGWVGVPFDVMGYNGSIGAVGVSAPLFVTKTVLAA